MINRSRQGHTAPQLCLAREHLIDKVVLARDRLGPTASVAGEDWSGATPQAPRAAHSPGLAVFVAKPSSLSIITDMC